MHSNEPRVNVINMLRLPRRDEISIHRLRIEHMYLTHACTLTTRGDSPSVLGLACQVDLTVEHVLLHYVSYTNARDDFFCLTLTSCMNCFRMLPHVQ